MKKSVFNFFKFLFRAFNSCIPKKSKRVLFITSPDVSGNGKAFSEYLVANKPQFEVVWIVKDIFNSKSRMKFTKKGTLHSHWIFLTSRYVITSHNEMISVKASNQVYISLWHGMPFKKISYLHPVESESSEYFPSLRISTSEMMRSLIAAAFREKADNVYITGQPRNDFLFEDALTLEQLGICETFDKVVFYAPTFRENQMDCLRSDGNKINGENFLRTSDFDLKALNSFFAKKKALLILKLHPYEERNFNEMDLDSNIKIITSHKLTQLQLDINHLLAIADILVSDYSSVFFDYMITNNPMIFLVPDKDSYSSSRGGFALEPFNFWTPGEKVISQNGLVDAITRLLDGNDCYQQERQNVNSIINKYSDNRNCERVFEAFFE